MFIPIKNYILRFVGLLVFFLLCVGVANAYSFTISSGSSNSGQVRTSTNYDSFSAGSGYPAGMTIAGKNSQENGSSDTPAASVDELVESVFSETTRIKLDTLVKLQAVLKEIQEQAEENDDSEDFWYSHTYQDFDSDIQNQVSGTSGASSCFYNWTRTLYEGQEGDDVKKLQEALDYLGYYNYGSITGYYGPVTETAVKRFQSDNDVVSSGTAETTGYGVFGRLTGAALSEKYCI